LSYLKGENMKNKKHIISKLKKESGKKNKAVKTMLKKINLAIRLKPKTSAKKPLNKKPAGKTTKKTPSKMITKQTTVVKVIKPKASAITGPMNIKPYKIKKNEPYMSKDQLRHFEQVLNIWKQQLMQEVDRTIYDMQDVANYSDPIDRASQEEEFNLTLRERDRERKLLKKIDEALDRIIAGIYGFCDECGAEIGVRRLEARPTATQCIECKTIAEIREKQTGG
jgi:DnaK suppressor protein